MTSVLFSEAIGVVWDLTNCPQKVTASCSICPWRPVDREWAVRVRGLDGRRRREDLPSEQVSSNVHGTPSYWVLFGSAEWHGI